MCTSPETINIPGESAGGAATDPSPPLRIRYRIRFAKTGLLRWISHRDLARLWERLLRRAALRLSMSEGFHPKPRISFPSALALGVEGLDEVVEIELAESWTPAALLKRLQDDDQPGLKITSVDPLPSGCKKARLRRSHYAITIPEAADHAAIDVAIAALLAQGTVMITRKEKPIPIDVNSQIESLRRHGSALSLLLAASDTATLRPSDVLDLLGFGDWVQQGALITRRRVELDRELDHQLGQGDPT